MSAPPAAVSEPTRKDKDDDIHGWAQFNRYDRFSTSRSDLRFGSREKEMPQYRFSGRKGLGMPKTEEKYVYMDDPCYVRIAGILKCFGRVPERFTKCFICKDLAVNVLFGNLDVVKPKLEAMSYGDAEDEDIAHALLLYTNSTIALPTCLDHTYGRLAN
jgi:hypothetical protein